MDIFSENKYFLRQIGIFAVNSGSRSEYFIKWLRISAIIILINTILAFAIGYLFVIDHTETSELKESFYITNAYGIIPGLYFHMLTNQSELWRMLEELRRVVNSRK